MQRLRIALLMLCLLPVLATAQEEPAAAADWNLPAPDPANGYHELLLPPAGYWGKTPEDDALLAEPTILPYQGWFCFLSMSRDIDCWVADERYAAIVCGRDIHLVDLASGEHLWQQNFGADFFARFPNGGARLEELYLADDILVYPWWDKLEARSLNDGSLLWTADLEYVYGSFGGHIWAARNGPRQDSWNDPDTVCCLDPADGSILGSWQVEPVESTNATGIARSGNLHVFSGSTEYEFTLANGPQIVELGSAASIADKPMQTSLETGLAPLPDDVMQLTNHKMQRGNTLLLRSPNYLYHPGSNVGIYGLLLDEDGQPIPGNMTLHNMPAGHELLQARFIASADPLADRELMSAIIASGETGLNTLSLATADDDAVHLDAMALACHYLMDPANRGGSTDIWAFDNSSGALSRHLSQHSSAQSLPSLLRWQDMPLFAGQQIELREAISNCGAAGASYLAGNDQFGYSGLHEQAPGPYPVREDNFELYSGGDRHVSIPGWAEVHSATPDRIAVFTSPGLYDDREIFIGFDPVEDQGFRHVLPTGLLDRVSRWHGNLAPIAWLDLRDAGDGKLSVLHNQLKPDADLEQYPIVDPVLDYVESPLSLDEVQRDSDGDGLTDITERLLILDPANPDCDGDGIPDGADCTPNADPAAMGPVERGIARALAMYWPADGSGSDRDWIASVETGSPWQARYFTVYNSGPVAFARSAGEYSICLDGSANQSLNNGDAKRWEWPANSITLEWIDRRGDPIEGYKRSQIYQYYLGEGREFTEDELRKEAESWQRFAGLYYFDPDKEADEAGPDAVLQLFFDRQSELILFRLVDGEYWPYSKRVTGVSCFG